MPRAPQFDAPQILAAARAVAAADGPVNVTIGSIAKVLDAPVGSIYYRFRSRDEILARLWLDLVEGFQSEFFAHLGSGVPAVGGLAAVRYIASWVAAHPAESRIMLLHRRDDFAAATWPPEFRERAKQLSAQAVKEMKRYARRLTGKSGADEIRRVKFAVIDLPLAALRPEVEQGLPPNGAVVALLGTSCRKILVDMEKRHEPN